MKQFRKQWTAQQFKEYIPENSIFYDIETTGLSRERSFAYMIGTFQIKSNTVYAIQWFAENEEQEKEILEAFAAFCSEKNAALTVQYNGDSFDQPFLKARYEKYGLTFPLENLPSLDLYKKIKPLKALLKLPNMKQPSLENFLELTERKYPDGGENLKKYRQYQKGAEELLEVLIGHNEEDLMGLSRIPLLLSYLEIWESPVQINAVTSSENKLIFSFTIEQDLPMLFSNQGALYSGTDFYITGEHSQIHLLLKRQERGYPYYYFNYKDYYYIPSENMAMSKSIASFLDASLRKKAVPGNCFTWFLPNQEFLNNKDLQISYLQHLLPRIFESI